MFYWGAQSYYEPMVWVSGRVGDYAIAPKDPFEAAKKLRGVAEKRDVGATFTRNKALETHAAGDVKVALEANADASNAWNDVRVEAHAGLQKTAQYEALPNHDPGLVSKWKTEGAILISTAGARIQFLETDRATLLSTPTGGGFHLPPGSVVQPGEAPPSGATDWGSVATSAAIVAGVSAIVYTGWKLLTKGSL